MATTFVHGQDTFISVAGDDISEYTNSSELEETADSHDVTHYGKGAHVKQGGLDDGKFSCSGTYDKTAVTGPRAVLQPLKGTVVEVIFRPDGTGSAKAQDKFDLLVTKYVQTAPVADMVTWSLEGEVSDEVDHTPQAA